MHGFGADLVEIPRDSARANQRAAETAAAQQRRCIEIVAAQATTIGAGRQEARVGGQGP